MQPGERIGPYLLISRLGSGGMGEVFSAVHERMGQIVALKLLTRIEPAAAARFIQEARALSQLDHPGVVRVLFLGEMDDGTAYLVLEQIAGRSLRQLLGEPPCGLPQARALDLIAQAAAAMTAVHQRGIVHRDLKPDNILVATRPGESDMVKIIDFGIARVSPPLSAARSAEGPLHDTLIETGDEGPRWLGTAAYMAPEQCRRSTQIGPAADTYALGVVLYETLCGHPPFGAKDPVELAAMHLHAEPDLSGLPTATLRRLVGAMLAKDPARRPAMAAIATTLARLAEFDGRRRAVSGGLLAAAGALLIIRAGTWARGGLRAFFPQVTKKNLPLAIARPENGVSSLQMQHSGLILIAHMDWGSVTPAELLATLPAAYQQLPHEILMVPVTGVAARGDQVDGAARIEAWFQATLQPLMLQHPDYQIVYFGLAPIPLIVYLGWLVGPTQPVAVRLRHHTEKRFLPWTNLPSAVSLSPLRWSCEGDERAGEVVVRLSTSHRINEVAARAQVPSPLCEVDLQLIAPSEDVFRSEAELAVVVQAWKRVLDEITERFPRVQRVHLFASVQAGVAFLMGTAMSRTMHLPITIYQYQAPGFKPGLTINNPSPRPAAPDQGAMEFQSLFVKFHEKIKLKDTEENAGLRTRRDEVLSLLRQHMWERYRLRFEMFNSGSYAMGTGVQPLPGADYDIDVGLVFDLEHAQKDARQLKQQVHGGLPSSLGRIEWRRPCITVFRKGHHVDLGVYVKDGGGLWLAVGRQADATAIWQQDGIKLFIQDVRDRFPNPRADHEQFQRVIRYLKRWKDVHFQGNGVKAPVGLALTVMAYYWFSAHRSAGVYNDLAALTALVRRVLEHFNSGQLELKFPRSPGDNLLRKLSHEQIRQVAGRFQTLLSLLTEAASKSSTAPLVRAFGVDFPES